MPETQPLAALRVLDLSGKPGAYATKLLADLGAVVTKVEPPEGDPMRRQPPFKGDVPDPEASLSWAYYHANKRSIVLALEQGADRRTLDGLIARSDAVVASWTPRESASFGLTFEAVHALNREAVLCWITPFGRTGPYRDFRATHLTTEAMGGQMYGGDPAAAPIAMPGRQDFDLAGIHAALAILAAVQNRGEFEGQEIDVSVQEVLATQSYLIQRFSLTASVQARTAGRAFGAPPGGTWRCADGEVSLAPNVPEHWRGIHEVFGHPPQFAGPEWEGAPYRLAHAAELRPYVEDFMSCRRKEDVASAAQAAHCPAAPLNSVGDYFNDAQPRARGFFVDAQHPRLGTFEMAGSPWGFGAPLWQVKRPAPSLDQDGGEVRQELASSAVRGARGSTPLRNLRVLSFGTNIAGNHAAMLLAELGLEVVKIDPRTRPDMVRGLKMPDHSGAKEPGGFETSVNFAALARSVSTLSLNMAQDAGRELFRRLVAKADVVLENFSPTVMPRWGLDYASLATINSRIVMVSLPGLGNRGPKHTWITYANVIAALVGLSRMWPGTRAHHDYVGAAMGAFAALAGIARRDLVGTGMHFDIAQSEAGAAMMGSLLLDYAVNGRDAVPAANREPGSAYSAVLRARGDDSWIAIEAEDERDWAKLAAAIGREDLVTDERFATAAVRGLNLAALDAVVEQWTSARSPHQAMTLLQKAGVAAGAVQNAEDLFRDPQLRTRDFIVETLHPDLGGMAMPQSPHRLSRTPGRLRRVAPRLGQDNEAVLGAWLGMTPADVARLAEAGIL